MRKSSRRGKRKGFSIRRMLGLNPNFVGRTGKQVVEVMPLIAGVVANNLVTGTIAKIKVPLLQKGVGNYALGLLDAALLGWAGTSMVGKQFGNSIKVGGWVEVLGRAIHDMMSHGVVEALKPGLSGIDDMGVPGYWAASAFKGHMPLPLEQTAFQGFMGMNDFVSPGAIANAFPAQQNYMQYAMPNSNAVGAPMHPGFAQPNAAGAGGGNYRPGMPSGVAGIDMLQEHTIADEIGRGNASMAM